MKTLAASPAIRVGSGLAFRRHVSEYAFGSAAAGEISMVPGMLDVKGTKILAKSLFKELRGNGYSPNQILSLSTELIDLVTQSLKSEQGEGETTASSAVIAKEGWRAAL
jgi:hypothetical protein